MEEKATFLNFRNALQPTYSVSLELDITNFLRVVKENDWPFSIQVHHSFVDGFHVGKFVKHLEESLNRQ